MSEEGWREPETSAAAGRQRGPRNADPFAPPSDTAAGTAALPPEALGVPGHWDAQVCEASPDGTAPANGTPPSFGAPASYGTPPSFGTPPSLGMPAAPPHPHAYAPPSYPPAGAQPYGYPPYGYAPAPQRTSGLAVASLVLGLVWIYWIGSILAVIFGHIALAETKRDPRVGGRGMAVAGLVLGYLGLGTLLLVLMVFTAAP